MRIVLPNGDDAIPNAEFADKLGVVVRTLNNYDREGLPYPLSAAGSIGHSIWQWPGSLGASSAATRAVLRQPPPDNPPPNFETAAPAAPSARVCMECTGGNEGDRHR